MYRSISVLFILLMMLCSANAEVGVSVGARAGFNIAHLRKFTPPDTYRKRVVLGSDLAAVLRIDFNRYIGLQTEVEFSQKGQAWKRSADSARYVSKMMLNYIQFPVLAVAKVGNENVKGVFYFGPYFSYWAGGYTQHAKSVDKQSKNSSTEKYIFSGKDMRFDMGLVTGAGANIRVGKGWIEVAARHNLGLLSTTKKNAGLPKMYNCNFNLSLGYLYTIK